MPNENKDPGMSTEQVMVELKAIRERQEKQMLERHRANNELTKTISQFSLNQLQHQDEIIGMKTSLREINEAVGQVAELADDVRQIKNRLIGDNEMQSKGLIRDVENLQEWRVSVETRLKDVEFVKRALGAFAGLVAVASAAVAIFQYINK